MNNPLMKLWAKVPQRAPAAPPPAALGAGAGAALPVGPAAGDAAGPELGASASAGAAGADTRADSGGCAGAGAVGVGAAGAGAAAATAAAPWKPNTRGRGRPKGSKNKIRRERKKPRRESTASAPTAASSGRLPGSHGPRPGSGGGAKWSEELKGYALCTYDRFNGQLTRTVTELLRTKPEWFGAGCATLPNGKPAAALSPQLLGQWVDKRARAQCGGTSSLWFDTSVGGKRAGAGRHRLVPADVLQRIISAWAAVLSSKKTLFTTVQLRSVAIGVLVSAGLKDLLGATHASGARVFACSRVWVARQCAAQGWRFKKPFGDSDKPPANMNALIRDYVDRVAYFVRQYRVPKELVINPDHTGLHYTQIKGGGWTADKDTPAVASGGNKRECTLVPCSSAAGRVCPVQIVVAWLAAPQAHPWRRALANTRRRVLLAHTLLPATNDMAASWTKRLWMLSIRSFPSGFTTLLARTTTGPTW
jgi:hypothetical protein